ncbi:MAG TPA: hypothetical protein VFT56_00280 [Sphingomonas sp.]|nr:hypothetical protein [Sphingomonas sp.]
MTKTLLLAVALAGTAIGGAAYAAQDTAPAPAPAPAAPHMHHRGHGDMLARLDANHDGVITREEATAAALARFDRADTNHDGKIDQSEIAAMKAKAQSRTADRRARWQARRAAQSPTAPADQPADQ